MYTIPVGQNPTGSVSPESSRLRVHAQTLLYQTMSIERKKRIYDICVEYGSQL